MKKATIAIVLLALGALLSFTVVAQTENESGPDTTLVDSVSEEAEAPAPAVEEEKSTPPKAEPVKAENAGPAEVKSFQQVIKEKFVEGGVYFMGIVLVCLILGLAIAIERIIALNLATTNSKQLLSDVQGALLDGDNAKAKDICAKTPGPVASIFAQGIMRIKDGINSVEKSIIAYGSVEMGKLERGLTWISLFISLAPMFGFMGTVIGMIDAFDQIQLSETIEISEVAGGIKIALLTTVAGLIVAVILQIAYNYCISKIDAIVNDMEEASISFVDALIADEVASTDSNNGTV